MGGCGERLCVREVVSLMACRQEGGGGRFREGIIKPMFGFVEIIRNKGKKTEESRKTEGYWN